MVKSTVIARTVDGLILAASMDDEETDDFTEYKSQAKLLFKKLSSNSDQKCSIDSGPFIFHYTIEQQCCFLVICDKSYPKKLAFSFLDELVKEFLDKFGNEVGTVARPYAFVKFDTFIQKTKKAYKDTRTNQNLDRLNDELNDVTRIMTKNISDVLGRGEMLNSLAEKGTALSDKSKKYLRESKKLQYQAMYKKYGPPAFVIGVVVLVLLFRYWIW